MSICYHVAMHRGNQKMAAPVIEKRGKGKWRSLHREIASRITDGKYLPGDPIPGESHLAREAGMARNTVRQALAALEKDGFVRRIRGKGTFVSKQVNHTHALQQQDNAFGLVMPDIRRSLYPSLLKGFDFASGQQHRRVLTSYSDHDVNKQGEILLQLLGKRMAGVALVTSAICKTPPHHVHILQQADMPVVMCHRPVADVQAPLVTWDREQVGYLAGQTVIKAGHKRIGYLSGPRYSVTELHLRGLRRCLAEHQLELSDRCISHGVLDTLEHDDDKVNQVRRFLAAPDAPTAVICNDDDNAEFVYWVAHHMGLRVPADISVIGFGDRNKDTFFRKLLTSITIDEFQLGVQAATLLHEMNTGLRPIHDATVHNMNLVVCEGQTVAPAAR